MSAASLYEALHATISEQLSLDDPISTVEVIGAIEMVKHDLLVMFDDEDDDDGEPEACGMPAAA
jgi:hypothetical protein